MHDFWDRFYPRILNVYRRDAAFWERTINNQVISPHTGLLSFVFVCEGEGSLELDGTRYPLASGSLFQIPLGRHLILSSSTTNALNYYTIQYDYTMIVWEGGHALCKEPAEKLLPLPLAAAIANRDGMMSRMERLYTIWNSRQSQREAKAKRDFLSILLYANEELSDRRQEDATELAIRDSAAFIEENYRSEFQRSMLARRVSLSDSYFSVLFKRYLGCTPVQYMTRIRMNKAMQLLKESNLPIAEVAGAVGYEDALYFTRVFSRQVGMTPREYRNA